MTNIPASKETIQAFEKLKKELKTVYPEKKLTNDDVLGAMIAGFFDSLAHMKGHTGHAHKNEPDACCGGGCGCE